MPPKSRTAAFEASSGRPSRPPAGGAGQQGAGGAGVQGAGDRLAQRRVRGRAVGPRVLAAGQPVDGPRRSRRTRPGRPVRGRGEAQHLGHDDGRQRTREVAGAVRRAPFGARPSSSRFDSRLTVSAEAPRAPPWAGTARRTAPGAGRVRRRRAESMLAPTTWPVVKRGSSTVKVAGVPHHGHGGAPPGHHPAAQRRAPRPRGRGAQARQGGWGSSASSARVITSPSLSGRTPAAGSGPGPGPGRPGDAAVGARGAGRHGGGARHTRPRTQGCRLRARQRRTHAGAAGSGKSASGGRTAAAGRGAASGRWRAAPAQRSART